MTEASRVQTLLSEQNAEIYRSKNRIETLLFELRDARDRIEELEDVLKELLSLGGWGLNDLAKTIVQDALQEKKGA